MERTSKPRAIIVKEGWRDIIVEDTFPIPPEVVDVQAYIDREKIKDIWLMTVETPEAAECGATCDYQTGVAAEIITQKVGERRR